MHYMPTPPVLGKVYYATDGALIKIGRSVSPKRRGGELQVEMLMTFDGGDLEEKRHQRMWAKYRIGTSEWFRPGDDLLLWLSVHLLASGRRNESQVLQRLVLGLKQSVAA